MPFFSPFLERFRRVTSGGTYLPEVDGLRFIALALVAFLLHMGTYIHGHVLHLNSFSLLYSLCWNGAYGVPFFFIISGFILSLPFARQHLLSEKKVSIKNYFFRRLTRLEPAYIISLVIYFILRVWVMRYETFSELLPHFFASFFYLHNIIYNAHPIVNAVAWSLEIEVQFYLLAPLLCFIYCLKNSTHRRIILCTFIIIGIILDFNQQYHIGTILNKGGNFIAGMLMTDLYLLRKKEHNSPFLTALGAGCFILSLFVPAYYVSVWFCLLKMLLTFIFFYLVLTNATLKKWLSFQPIAIIGGMCYSIYLIHQGILGSLRHRFATINFSNNNWINGTIHYIIALTIILIVSGIFFLLIEKPTMKRDWYKRFFKFTRVNERCVK